MSDFPEFDAQYQTILVKDKADRFEQLAAEANFNVYHSDIWRGTGRRFAELIVRECIKIGDNYQDILGNEPECVNCRKVAYGIVDQIKQHFGVD